MADASLVFSILGVDKASGVLDSIAGKLGGMSKAAVLGLSAIATGAVGATAMLYGVGATFDDLSDTIQTTTGASGAALDGLVDSAKHVAANVPVEFDKIGPAIAEVHQRLGLTGPVLETVASQFLNLGNILGQDVDIDAATGALSIFGIKGDQVSGALDGLFTITQKSGIGFNDLTTLLAKSGASVQALGLDFNTTAGLIGSLDKAGVDSGAVITSMQKGLVTLAKAGEAPQETFRNVVGRISEFTAAGNTAAAIDLASTLFGTKGAAQFVAAVQSGAVSMDVLTGAVAAQGDGINKTAADTADFAEAWQIFKNRALLALEPVATRVFAAFGTGMKWFNEVGSPALATFAAVASEKLAPAVDKVASFISTQVVPAVFAFGNYIRTTVIPAAIEFGGWLQKYSGWLIPIAAGVGAIVVAIKVYQAYIAVVTAVTKVWTAAQVILNAVLSMNPIGLIVLAIIGLIAVFAVAWANSETFRDVVTGAFNTVLGVITGVWNWVAGNWPLLLAILTGPIGLAVLAISRNWDTIKDGISAVKDWIAARIDDVVGFFTGLPSRIGSAVGGMFDGIKDAFKSAVNWIIDKWNGLSFTIGGGSYDPLGAFGPTVTVPQFTFGTPDIPRFAKGGIAVGPQLAVIGDNRSGKEAVIPLERAGEFGFGGKGQTVTLVIEGDGSDPMVAWLRKAVRVKGGSVQAVLGS